VKLVSVEQMRDLERQADAAGHSYAEMMEQAGFMVSGFAGALLAGGETRHALVLVGPGNNGGDGLVAAHYLREVDCDITLYIWRRDIKGDPNFARLKRRRRGVTILWADNDPDFGKLREEMREASLVIDALLGTGAARPIEGRLQRLMQVVGEEIAARRRPQPRPPQPPGLQPPQYPLAQALVLVRSPGQPFGDEFEDEDCEEYEFGRDDYQGEPYQPATSAPSYAQPTFLTMPVLAVDCPSGLNCDTGELDPVAIPATFTVTFACPKWGQVQFPGAGACGLLAVVDIGIPEELGQSLPVELVDKEAVAAWLPERPADAHKGIFGKVMVVGGSITYSGAPILSAAAASRAGAGLVTAAVPLLVHAASAGNWPEFTWLPLPAPDGVLHRDGVAAAVARLRDYNAALIGPGLTTEPHARDFLLGLLDALPGALDGEAWQGRLIFDADALNVLAGEADWPRRIPAGSVLTPHPGEMSRLTELSIEEVNARRILTARHYAEQWGHVVLLKGPYTVVAHPDGRTAVLPFANAALAKAGSGDVLAGIILAMLGQGLGAFEAATLGAYTHALSGFMVGQALGAASVTARDLAHTVSPALQELQLARPMRPR